MADRPRIVVDPAVRWGRPHLEGTNAATVDVAGMIVAGETVATVADEYGLTRHQVLLACWHEGQDGHWQKLWGGWSTRVADRLARAVPAEVDGLPDPPVPGRPTGRVYRYCLECDTTFRTGGELRRAKRRAARRTYGRGMWRWRWRAYLTRASRIRACPRCLHDWP